MVHFNKITRHYSSTLCSTNVACRSKKSTQTDYINHIQFSIKTQFQHCLPVNFSAMSKISMSHLERKTFTIWLYEMEAKPYTEH
jgi:hypothetical protein